MFWVVCFYSLMFQSDITDINTIFKDLAVLVHEQGDMIGKMCM